MNEVHIIAPSVNFGSLVSQIPGFGFLSIGSGLPFRCHQVCQMRFRIGRIQSVMQMLKHFLVRQILRAKFAQQLFQISAATAKPMRALLLPQFLDLLLQSLFLGFGLLHLLLQLLLLLQQLIHPFAHRFTSFLKKWEEKTVSVSSGTVFLPYTLIMIENPKNVKI